MNLSLVIITRTAFTFFIKWRDAGHRADVEPTLRQSLLLSSSDPSISFTRPLAGPNAIVALILIFLPALRLLPQSRGTARSYTTKRQTLWLECRMGLPHRGLLNRDGLRAYGFSNTFRAARKHSNACGTPQ